MSTKGLHYDINLSVSHALRQDPWLSNAYKTIEKHLHHSSPVLGLLQEVPGLRASDDVAQEGPLVPHRREAVRTYRCGGSDTGQECPAKGQQVGPDGLLRRL